MRFLWFFIALNCFYIVEGFGQKNKVFFHELDYINGLFFVPNHQEPFSGTAVGEFPDEKKQASVSFKAGKRHGVAEEWAKNGTKIYEANFENGMQSGIEKHWYATGDKKLSISYQNGLTDGICTEWYKNQNKKSEGLYVKGKEEGEHNWWYSTGEKDQQVFYKNGLTEGIVKNWHKNGTLSLESHYKAGKKQGLTRKWYETGQLRHEEFYQDDIKHGESKYFAKSGQLIEIQEHQNGKLIRDENYRSGNIRSNSGFMEVYNDKDSYFMIHITGDEVSPREADTPTYAVDGDMLQLYSKPIEAFLPDVSVEKGLSEKEILEKSIAYEVGFIEKMTEQSIEPNINFKQNNKGQTFAHWFFRSPSADDEKQKARTVQEEHYISFVCNKKILNLYSVVTNSDTKDEIEKLLFRQANNLEVKNDKIELNALAKKLLR